MSKRVLAPVLLFVAALAAVAAVFAVHRIEARGGPLSEPYATQFFSPGLNAQKGAAIVRFTPRETQRVTITIRTCDEQRVVRRLVTNRTVSKSSQFRWDGRDDDDAKLPDGCYEVRIALAGDRRVYQPAKPTYIDTKAPTAAIDRSAIADGSWNGLVFITPGSRLEFETPDGERIDPERAKLFNPKPAPHSSGTAKFIDPPADTEPKRFAVELDGGIPLRAIAVDQAGNERRLADDLFAKAEVIG